MNGYAKKIAFVSSACIMDPISSSTALGLDSLVGGPGSM